MRRFRVYGLSIASDFDLLLPEDSDAAAPAVTISRAHPTFFKALLGSSEEGSDAKLSGYRCFADGSSHLSWNDIFDFFIAADGRTIVCGPRRDALSEGYISYLLGFALNFALLRIGEEVLHATVIEWRGEAIGFLGKSGAGKSTLASYFLGRGFRLVTDDLLRVTFIDQSVIAHPGPQRIKLFPEGAAKFMQGAPRVDLVSPFTSKQLIVPARDQRIDTAVPLRALYLLDCGGESCNEDSVSAQRLHSAEAALSCLASTFNDIVQTSERLGQQLRFAGQILSKIPILRLSYPRRFEALSSVYKLVVTAGLGGDKSIPYAPLEGNERDLRQE